MRMASFQEISADFKDKKIKKSLGEQTTSAAAVGKPGGPSKQSDHLMQSNTNSTRPDIHIGKMRYFPTEIVI